MTETGTGYSKNLAACIANQPWNKAEVYACALVGSEACPENENCAVYKNHQIQEEIGPVSPAATVQAVLNQDDI